MRGGMSEGRVRWKARQRERHRERDGEREREGEQNRTRQPGIKYICFLWYQISIDGSYLPYCTHTLTHTASHGENPAMLKINYSSVLWYCTLDTQTHTAHIYITDIYSTQVKVAGQVLPSCSAIQQELKGCIYKHTVVCVCVYVHASVTVCLCIAVWLRKEKAAAEKEDKVAPCRPHNNTPGIHPSKHTAE